MRKYLFGFALLLILILSIVLRFYKLETYPGLINQDELSNIYDGYTIAETGADRWGLQYPIILRGFGEFDFRPPLNAWLCAASIKILGYSVFAGRLPSAILGFLSLIILFLVAQKIGKNVFAFFAVLFASLSPWHILFSRMAHEGTILPSFFLILSFYLWLLVKEYNYKLIFIIMLALCTGLATNAYQSTKLIFFILAILFAFDILKNAKFKLKSIFIFGFFVTLGAFPQLLAAYTMPEHFFTRATNGTVNQFSISIDFFSNFCLKFYANLAPKYLFFSFGDLNNLTIGRLLAAESLFFYCGLFVFMKVIKPSNKFNSSLIYFLIFVAILPSALTPDNPHAIRSSATMVLFPLISASGVLFFYNRLKGIWAKEGFLLILFLVVLGNFAFVSKKYFGSHILQNMGQQSNVFQINNKLNKYLTDQRKVYIEDYGNMIYIYNASFNNMKPLEFQNSPKIYEDNGFGGDHFVQLGKYNYLKMNAIDSILNQSAEKYLLVLQSKNKKYNLVDSLKWDGQTTYFYKN